MRVRSAAALVLLGGSLAGLACSSFGSSGPTDEPVDAGADDAPVGDDAASDAGDDARDATTCTGVATESDAGEDATCGADGLVDLGSSDDHCGFCAHACKSPSPACHGGHCDAITVVGETLVSLGTVTADEIFFGHYQVAPFDVRASRRSDGSVRVLGTSPAAVYSVILEGATVFVEALDGIHSVPAAGADGGALTDIALAVNVFHHLAVDPSYVYWANTENGDLVRYDRATATTASIDNGGPGDTIGTIAADAKGVVWSTRGTACAIKTRRVNAPGNTSIRLPDRCVGPLAIDATSIWFGEDGRIWRLSRDGTDDPVLVATWDGPKKHPLGLLPDGDRVLWVANGDDPGGPDQHSVLFEAPACGGTVRRLVDDVFLAVGMAADTDYVYVGSGNGVLRFAK